MIGNLAFDHIWQALYFMGCGSILAEVVSVLRDRAAAADAAGTAANAVTVVSGSAAAA
jgi:hypothetical protein